MDLRLHALAERLRSSLFFVPLLLVLVGGSVGQAMVAADAAIGDGVGDLPFVLTSTVDSAREVLSIVASATITVAGIAFSVSLLVIQQASSQYSPRVVHSLFRDPFNRRVMGVVVGTFTYCLMVLRAVRGPLEDGGEPVVPNLSVGVAVVLGVVAILAIVAFINHNAHTMEVSQLLGRVAAETVEQIERTWPDRGEARKHGSSRPPSGPGHAVKLGKSGWLQQVSNEQLLDLVPDGGTVRLDTAVGRYAVQGTPLCTLWPPPTDAATAADQASEALQTGPVRTMQQDASYGVRQIVDVALIALSPGVNDPTTAQDAIFHLAQVVVHALARDAPEQVVSDDRGRRLLMPESHTHETIVALAFDEIRRAASDLPAVCIYLLEALHLVEEAMPDEEVPRLAAIVRRQADLVLAESQRSDVLPADRQAVKDAFDRRFDPAER